MAGKETLLHGEAERRLGRKTAGAAAVFSLRKKGMAVGLVSDVSGRRCCLGREGERRPEEGHEQEQEQKQRGRWGETAEREKGLLRKWEGLRC